MRRAVLLTAALALAAAVATGAQAKQRYYKWVKDRQVSSREVLPQAKSSRVVNLPEARALELVRAAMTDDLYLALAEYHATRHQQDAETTPDTVLPEEVVRQEEVYLVDEDYRFLLEVKLKQFGARTRVTAAAFPVYRVRDLDKEAEMDEDSAGSGVEVKISADEGQAVAVGPMFVVPVPGRPGQYGAEPLPDAARRAAQLVRSFLYLLDRRVAGAR